MPFHMLKGRARHKDPNGYIVVYYPEHPNAYRNGHVYYHRIKMENMLGRYLEPWEVVHHKDGNRRNNKKANLELITQSKHTKKHQEERGYVRGRGLCPICDKEFPENRKGQIHCSTKCASISSRKSDRISPEELAKLVWRLPRLEIARRLGVSDSAVKNWCKKWKIDYPTGSQISRVKYDWKKPTKKKLKKLIWSSPLPKLIKKLEVPESVIRRWCKEYKLKTPPPGYWRKVETGNA